MSYNNTKQFDDLLEDLDSLSEDMIDALLTTGDEIVKDIERTHRAGQSPDGKKWNKREKAYPHPQNNKTGKLLNSYKATPNDSGNKLSIQNTAAYAYYVDRRTPLLSVSEIPVEWTKELQEALDEFVEEWNRK